MTGSYVRLELARALRNPVGMTMMTVFPLLLFLLWAEVLEVAPPGRAMVSMATYGAMGGAMFVGGAIAMERAGGWLRQLAVTPLPAHGYVTAKLLGAAAGVLPSVLVVLAAGALLAGVRLPAGTWAALVPLIWAGALPFAALGVAFGYTFRGQLATLAMTIVYFALSVVGGLWVPVERMPSAMRALAEYSPTYQVGSLGWRALEGRAPTGTSLAVLAAWTLGFVALALWRYRRAL
ncbi:ABC transporter permease [Actinomadura sp. ATCC 31491]|uniref:ABC transporter permease n=1 Tax=Actinomadura luzonensis TaxID=2805427 RepID=A0ABT0G2Y2_9ACTN|nr:ABC transporter permease [Actinomadura luzonensis]MCK2218763.1 ABC transporter permease [Actinomadura luzonensis]